MFDETFGDLLEYEDQKRDACWDPLQHERVLQQTMAWADAQTAVPGSSPQACVELRQQKANLAGPPSGG